MVCHQVVSHVSAVMFFIWMSCCLASIISAAEGDISTTVSTEPVIYGNPNKTRSCLFYLEEVGEGRIFRNYGEPYPFDEYEVLKSHRRELGFLCLSNENFDVSRNVLDSVVKFAKSISNFECSDPDATQALKSWLRTNFTPEDLFLWRYGVDKTHHQTTDRYYSLHARLPCYSDYWISGLWLPRPAWSHIGDKSILPLKCPQDDAVDLGALKCLDKQEALSGNCSFVVNYLCASMILPLYDIGSNELSSLDGSTQPPSRRCLMYSFGLGANLDLERFMADVVGCEVHGFDPAGEPYLSTHIELMDTIENGYFHHASLSHVSGKASVSGVYGNKDTMQSRQVSSTLFDFWNRLHAPQNRYINVLQIDCEGCEWLALHQIATETPHILKHTSLITMELHLTYELGVPFDVQLEVYASFWEHYMERMGFRIFVLNHVVGWDAHRSPHRFAEILGKLGFEEHTCCVEIGLFREVAYD